ncbi:hypothetical protein ACHQM5_024637 [Ranunculus cassubicifolius]
MDESALKSAIISTEINTFVEADRVVWRTAADSTFSTKQAYRDLQGHYPIVYWWRLVWGKFNIPKHGFLVWQLFSGGLPTQDRLVKKNVLTSSECIFCQREKENSNHLFFDCEFGKKLWNFVKVVLGLDTNARPAAQEWNYILQISRGKTTYANIIRAAVCSVVAAIWKERNNRRFRKVIFDWKVISAKLLNDLRNYLEMEVEEVQHPVKLEGLFDRLQLKLKLRQRLCTQLSWTPPQVHQVKINADGALALGRGGYGGIIRSHVGQVFLCYGGPSLKLNICYLELLGIREGLKVAFAMGHNNIIIESDSLSSVRMLRKEEKVEKPIWLLIR